MKMHLFLKKSATICLIAFSIFSCKKNTTEPLIQQINTENATCNCEMEVAFPDIKGEMITIGEGDKKIVVEKKSGYYVFGGDMLLTEEQINFLKARTAGRTAVAGFVRHWFKGIVPYVINSGLPDQQRVTNAIAHWESVTSLHFVPRTTQADYIEFVFGSECASQIGRIGGRQEVILGNGCTIGNTIHEIGHAIGFFHEHQRQDRGNFIQINWQNIISGLEHNFQTYVDLGEPGFELGTLDFNSVMMYGSDFFSANGFPTVTRLDGTTFSVQRNGLSTGDIETAAFIYGPPFVKLRYVQTDYSTPDNTYIVADVYADFFADDACTIPFTLPAAKSFPIKVEQSNYQGGWGSSSYTYMAQVPQGSSSVLLEQSATIEQISYDFGNIVYGFRQDFTALDGFAR